jgi:hypothetical protein
MLSKIRTTGVVMAIGIQALWLAGCGSSSEGGAPATDGGPSEGGGGTGGSLGYGDGATITPGLGDSCGQDTDCQAGLTCLKSTDSLLGGGPANGYCTMPCMNNGDCIPSGGACVGDGVGQPYCLLACTTGAGDTTRKCNGRRDLACEGLVSSTGMETGGACFPFCADDSECGTFKCNLGTGQCVASIPQGLPIGSSCTANVDPDPCLGVCLPLEDGTGPVPGLCSAPCRFGRLEGCGYHVGALDASASVAGACALPLTTTGDLGDIGICLQMCDTDSDCLATNFGCDLDAVATWKHGVCLPKDTTGDGGIPAADGGSTEPDGGVTPTPDAGVVAPDAPAGD